MKHLHFCWLLVLVTCLLGGFPGIADATTCEFYYQRIEKVVQVNNPEPEGWWEHTKAFAKGVVNTAKHLWSNNIEPNFFPGEGTKMRFSGEDENIAYQLERVKVKDEQHLLSLMGCHDEADIGSLTNGQRALLAMYRQAFSEAKNEREPYTIKDKISVFLTDTTGFEDERKYPHVTRDFWPTATASTIQINSKRYNYPGSEDDARSTFTHEFAHTMDRSMKEFINAYGKDQTHYANEMTRPRTAWLEGYAIFNEMIEFPAEARYVQSAIAKVRVESKKEAGSYTILLKDDPQFTGTQLLNVEGINSNILYRIATEIPDGKHLVLEATAKTNYPWRSLRHVISYLAKHHPQHLQTIAGIMDAETLGRLSDQELMKFIGTSDAAREFAASRHVSADAESQPAASLPTPALLTENDETGTSVAPQVILINPGSAGTNPFTGGQ